MRSVIVVTSNFHTRRARLIFRHVFPQGMEVRVASARNGDFDPSIGGKNVNNQKS